LPSTFTLLTMASTPSLDGRPISPQEAATIVSPYCTIGVALDGLPVNLPAFLAEQLRTKSAHGEFAKALIVIEEGARLRAEDMLKADDYFGPATDAFTTVNGDVKELGGFVPQKLPRLRHLGNHIFRNAVSRAEQAYEAMNVVHSKILSERREDLEIFQSSEKLQSLVVALDQVKDDLLLSNAARISEACIVVVQLCTLFGRRQYDLQWLGIDANLAAGADFHVVLRESLRDYDFFERIAEALDEIQRLNQGESPREEEIRRAVKKGGLVLVSSNRTCFWKGKAVQATWNTAHKPWEFLLLLAEAARKGGGVNPDDLYPERHEVSPATMASRWHRLDELLPASLGAHVNAIGRNSGYRLDLPRGQVSLFR